MKAKLTEDYLWRGVTYLKGDREIPDDLAIALGLTPAESGATDSVEPPTVAALVLINFVQSAVDMAILPTVGRGAAKRILDRRPEGGYTSLEQVAELCPEVTRQPYRVDWAQVQAWEG
jgi:hypothetical protein